nr:PREDICTED: vezatin isoform X2 [Latimeria chalumnae]|eukprot:XP_014350329.1 PREDICTED: vezatin isoform X2 [Latimeria chalumnae]
MTEELDEEVVFENSPLYQYLQDLGHTDFEICPAVSQEEKQCTPEAGQREQDVNAAAKRGVFLKIIESLGSWNPFPQCIRIDSRLHQLDVGFRLCSLRTILEQEVLLQEDVELIELLDPSILSAGRPQEQENGHPPVLSSLATSNIWDISVLIAFVITLIAVLTLWDGFSWLTWGPGLLAFSAYVVVRGFSFWKTAKLQMTMRKFNVQLEEIVTTSRAFTNLMRKALRLIQETEVISRGFTLLLDRVSAACPFNRAGQHPGQNLIGLRKAVYRTVRTSFQATRRTTCYMLKSYPLNSEIDNVTNYISAVPLNELGLGLSEEQVTEELTQEITDNYNLPSLKVLFQLWIGQSSEFFRRLALLLSPNHASSKTPITPEHLAHNIVSDVLQNLPHTLPACLAELKRSYEFHRYFQTHHESVSERSAKVKQKSGDLNNFYATIRSLHLHLKAVLYEVIILEDELEKLVGSKETTEMTLEFFQALEEKLKLIQPHMQASSSCWEGAVSQVEKMVRKPTREGKPAMSVENLYPTVTASAQPIIKIEDKDPVPEEQELEAYVEDSDSDGECRSSDFCYLSPEEKERQKREREESQRVLQELKSVLGLKASETERQRWKQLLFNDQAVVKLSSPVDTPAEPTSAPEPSRELSDLVPQEHCNGDTSAEEEAGTQTDSSTAGHGMRTEYVSPRCVPPEDPAVGGALFSKEAEESTHYQWDGVEEGEGRDGAGMEQLRPPFRETLQTSNKPRFLGFHAPADLNFTSVLAAQIAAKLQTFATMEEQTFGDEDEGDEEEVEAENEVALDRRHGDKDTEKAY